MILFIIKKDGMALNLSSVLGILKILWLAIHIATMKIGFKTSS